jgi:hypothetical protein
MCMNGGTCARSDIDRHLPWKLDLTEGDGVAALCAATAHAVDMLKDKVRDHQELLVYIDVATYIQH